MIDEADIRSLEVVAADERGLQNPGASGPAASGGSGAAPLPGPILSRDGADRLPSTRAQSVWRGEAETFTPWLGRNLERLSVVPDVKLGIVARELSDGRGFVDLVAITDESDPRLVVIENQYGFADSKHLGQMLLYVNELSARVAIWVAEAFHRQFLDVIDRLNEQFGSSCDFYAVQIDPENQSFTMRADPRAVEPRCERSAADFVRKVHGFWRTWERAGHRKPNRVEAGGARCFDVSETEIEVRTWIDRKSEELRIGLRGRDGSIGEIMIRERDSLQLRIGGAKADPFDHWLQRLGDDEQAWRAVITDLAHWVERYTSAARDILRSPA